MTPLMDFFELVHVADLILQMVQVFYAEEMCKHIDKMDFLNEANKEKKSFERMIDDGVAAGLDKSIEVMIDQVAYILATMQLPTDFNPEEGTDIELQPTNVSTPLFPDRIAWLLEIHSRFLTFANTSSLFFFCHFSLLTARLVGRR